MIDQKVEVGKIFRSLDEVTRMVVVWHWAEGQPLVNTDPLYIELSRLFQHWIGDGLIIHPPPSIEPFGTGPGITFPGIDFERFRLHRHEL